MDTVTVTINKKSYKAKIVGTDPLNDIALIKINRKKKFKPVYFGNSNKVKIGDFAVAMEIRLDLIKHILSGLSVQPEDDA